jgi:hypothetical protein
VNVRGWQTSKRATPWSRWHRLVLPRLHPNGLECGLTDLDGLAWLEWRRLPGQGRVPVALLEVTTYHETVRGAAKARLKNLEVLGDLARARGVPLFLVRFSEAAGRFEARSWPELQVVARGGLRDLASWIVELPPPPPTVAVKLTRSELETLEVAAQQYRCTPEELVELLVKGWLQRQATQTHTQEVTHE